MNMIKYLIKTVAIILGIFFLMLAFTAIIFSCNPDNPTNNSPYITANPADNTDNPGNSGNNDEKAGESAQNLMELGRI
jgi:hypothetical protein